MRTTASKIPISYINWFHHEDSCIHELVFSTYTNLLSFLNKKMTFQECNKQTYEDFFCLGINHLKDYLTIRGISTSSYTKIELVARSFSASELDIPIIQSTKEQAQILNEEYRQKLKDYNLPDPCKISNSEKIDDVKLWTSVNIGHIFEYIPV